MIVFRFLFAKFYKLILLVILVVSSVCVTRASSVDLPDPDLLLGQPGREDGGIRLGERMVRMEDPVDSATDNDSFSESETPPSYSNNHHGGSAGQGKPTKSTITPSPTTYQLPYCQEGRGQDNPTPGPSPGQRDDDKGDDSIMDGRNDQFFKDKKEGKRKKKAADVLTLVKRPYDLARNRKGGGKERQFLVATLDGHVSMLNRKGEEVWTVHTGTLFSSTIKSYQLGENGKKVNMIPSLTGGLYQFDGENLLPMPMTADSLLKNSLKMSSDIVISGGKELSVFGIDMKTGNVRYECGMNGCSNPQPEVGSNVNESADQMNLVITKQLQTVRAIDAMSGSEKWNFSVGTHELKVARVSEGCYEGEAEEGGVLDYIKMVIPEGRIFGKDTESSLIWDKKFESPIAQAWVLDNGRLIKVDPILNTPLSDEPRELYIGTHEQQLYIQESHRTIAEAELDSAGLSGPKSQKPLRIGWKPSGSPFTEKVDEETAITPVRPVLPLPTLPPFFVYKKDRIIPEVVDETGSTKSDDDDDDITNDSTRFDEIEEDESTIEMIQQVVIASLWIWWKEVLGISLFTAVLLNILLMKPIMRAVRVQTIKDMLRAFQQWNNRKAQDGMALVPLERREVVTYGFEESPAAERNRTMSSSSSRLESPLQQEFVSQYLKDFTPIECLGKGGFGVVFEAKKNIDGRNYAVKRIKLPNRGKARDLAMREVKALAHLDHRNIVRYFNAWIEPTPIGWLEENDPLWTACVGSPSPTCEYPSDLLSQSQQSISSWRNTYQTSQQITQRKKPDHSKISFSSTPNSEINQEEDSFIVFEKNETEDSFCTGDYSRKKRKAASHSVNLGVLVDSSGTSSVSGNGFWKRPTTLDIPSSSFNITENSGGLDTAWIEDDEADIEVGEEATETSSVVTFLYIQQELCQKRTLLELLRNMPERNPMIMIRLFGQINDAVEYVHCKKCIHRDLKPSNIFLAGTYSDGEEIVVKIGDFGLATTALAELENERKDAAALKADSDEIVTKQKINLTAHVGTHLYMSPEQNERKPYDYKVDIFSLGLIFFELLVAFSTEMERLQTLSEVRKHKFPSAFVQTFPEEHKLISEMISHNPHHRPDAVSINAWVKSHVQLLSSKESPSPTHSLDLKTQRSQSTPIRMNGGESCKQIFVDECGIDRASPPKRKFFKTHSTL